MGGDGKTGNAVTHPAFGDCVMKQGSNSVIWGKPRFLFNAGVQVTAQLNFELGLELAYADILMIALAAKAGIEVTAKAKTGSNAQGSGFLDQMEELTLDMNFGVNFQAGVHLPKWFEPAARILDICQEDSKRTDAHQEDFPSACEQESGQPSAPPGKRTCISCPVPSASLEAAALKSQPALADCRAATSRHSC